jgi:hypothetical protein
LRGYDLSNEFGERKEVGKVKKKNCGEAGKLHGIGYKPYAELGFRVGIGFSGFSGFSDSAGVVSLAGFFRFPWSFVETSVFFWCPVGASQVREPVKTAIP